MGDSKCLISLLLISVVGFGLISGQESPLFVNPNVVTIPNFEGWGTSLAWWPDILGAMSDDVITSVTSALFSPDKLNLNIVRYTIGGTTPGNYTCGPFRPGAATESFLDGPGNSYNWTRDPRQREILQISKTLGVDTFEAFSNSPPQWMTISGCSKGNAFGGILNENFAVDQAEAFAEYATHVIQHFHENWGITFQTYAPFNEPFGLGGIGGWYGELSSQEGCNMNRSVMAAIVETTDRVLKEKGMDYVKVTGGDETQINTETGTQNYFRDHGVAHCIEKVNTHGYWDNALNRRDKLIMASRRDGHRLWMDEMGWAGTPLDDMTQALTIANRILKDLKQLYASAWVYWQIVEGYGEWGVMNIPYDNPNATIEDVQYNSGYFGMMQFTKYIRKGYNILSVNDDRILAAYDGSTLVVVITNEETTNPTSHSISLSPFTQLGAITAITRTSPTEQNSPVTPAPSIENFQLNYIAPAQSLTTILISNVEHEISGNLLKNAQFEDEAFGPWIIEGESIGGIITNDDNVWNGKSTGYLENGPTGEARISQTVQSPKTGFFYLTAWCSTEIETGSKLGVSIANGQGISVDIVGGGEYHSYSFSFTAELYDNITVYFSTPEGSGISYFDDISLYSK